jgi:hypothetical protein
LLVFIMPRSPSICWPVCAHQTKDKTGKTRQNPLAIKAVQSLREAQR